MSSATSAVTYTSVYTDSEPDRAFWGVDDEEPLPPIDSPTIESPGHVTESDPEEDPEEYEDNETEDGPVDSPTDEGYHGEDDDGDSSRDDANDEDEDDEVVKGGGGSGEGPRGGTSISLPPEAESPPSAGERLARCMAQPAHSPALLPSSGCPTQIQTLRITSTQALIDAVTAALPSPPLPPSLYIPPPVDRRDDIPESEQPPRKRLYLSTLGSRYEVGESSTARPTRGQGIDYGIRGTWVDPAEAVLEIAPMIVGEVKTRVTELVELHEHDTQDLYALLEDAQDSRSRISQRVDMDSQRVDLLMGDRMTLQETVWMAYRDHVYAHETHLQAYQTHLQLQSTLIQTQHKAELLTLREQQRRARQPRLETRIPDHQDASGDADNHI
ncbi:hypothetical protein Tco_1302917 [Tanacetum coccineum]